tara:strand:+ start:944 stop:1207 length:264 start_codon:yes stop_codon:yes gene_type:complete
MTTSEFSSLKGGQAFTVGDDETKLLKLSVELCNFDDLCDNQRVRTKIVNETTGYTAVGRAAVVFNCVNLSTGGVLSVGDDMEVNILE